ncbi:Uncharacterised protein [Streptococcus pneumoniae]|nr:Uncharacterised protein [Streptococcus pneumoniae]
MEISVDGTAVVIRGNTYIMTSPNATSAYICQVAFLKCGNCAVKTKIPSEFKKPLITDLGTNFINELSLNTPKIIWTIPVNIVVANKYCKP